MIASNSARLKVLNHFFRARAAHLNRCHEPNEECARTAIRAHSIGSGSVLKRMSHDGHVVMLQLHLQHPRPPEVRFQRIGNSKATTFTGLCARHDNDLFRAIDDRPPNVEYPEHLFLLAYRATLREYHVALESACMLQSTYRKRVSLGLSPLTEPDATGLFATDRLLKAYDCYVFKRDFDQLYLASDWSGLTHFILTFPHQSPSIAVSSLFSLDEMSAPHLPRVALNVFPTGDDVTVIFSVLTKDKPFASVYLQRLLTAESHLQRYLLSTLVLQCCDNFVIHPHYYESMSGARRRVVRDYFAQTILHNKEDYEDARLYLF